MILKSVSLKYLFNSILVIYLDLILKIYSDLLILIIIFFLIFIVSIKKYSLKMLNFSYKNNFYFNFLFFLFFLFFYMFFYFNNIYKLNVIWLKKNFLVFNGVLNLNLNFDYINIYFVILSVFIFSILFTFNSFMHLKDKININTKVINILYFVIQVFLILTFLTSNIFFFFFFFECSLMPMYFLILILGKGSKKKHYASLSLVFFTLTGSIFLLFGLIYLMVLSKTCDFKNLNYEFLDFNTQIFLCLVFFIGFSVKVPIFPFYSWLPEAHVEAATSVSILLASIFLKVATYGILKIIVLNMFLSVYFLYSLIFYFSVISIIFASFLALIQTDLKKIIALSSVVHMNYIVIGLFSLDAKAIVASVIYMFSHAFVSTGLFYLVGILYENTGTRDLLNYNNNIKYSNNFFLYFFLFNLSNISFPFTISFISEIMLLNNLFYLNIVFIAIILLSIFFSVIYTFWIIHNLFFSKNIYLKNIIMLKFNDVFVLFLLISLIFLLGLAPFMIFYNLEQEIYNILIKKFNIF